jgi:hypothetical protein
MWRFCIETIEFVLEWSWLLLVVMFMMGSMYAVYELLIAAAHAIGWIHVWG